MLDEAAEVTAAVAVAVGVGLDVQAVDDGVLPPQVGGAGQPHAALPTSAGSPQLRAGPWRRTRRSNAVLLLADVVQGDLVEAQLGVPGELGGVPAEVVRRCAPTRRTCSSGDVLGDGVEGLGAVEVPADRRREDVAAPLVVGDRLGLGLVGRPAQVHLQVQRPAPARVPVGVDHLAAGARAAALTVISPSAHSAHQRAVATLTAAPISGGGSAGTRPQPGPVDGDQAVVADLLAAQQRPDDVDALAQPRVAHVLARPAGRR